MVIYKLVTKKQLLTFLACAAAVVLVFAGAASLEASANERLIPIYSVGRGESDGKQIALSFDAAWAAG